MAERRSTTCSIGGGLAAANCARWLREEGGDGLDPAGRAREGPALQPAAAVEEVPRGKESREEILFRPDEWWGEQKIELLTRTSVMKLDADERGGEALERATRSRSARRCWPPARTCAGCTPTAATSTGSTTCARSPTPTRSARRRRCRARRADRRLLHRLRGGGDADRGAGNECTIVMLEDVTFERILRQGGRRLLPARARGARRRDPRRRVARALRGRRRARDPGGHQGRAGARRDCVVIGAGVMPGRDAGEGGRARAGRGGRRDAAPRGSRPRCPASTRPATSASTTASSTGGRCGSSTGTSRSTRARPRR